MNKGLWVYFIMMLAMYTVGWVDARFLDKSLLYGIISIIVFGGLGLLISQSKKNGEVKR